jgi:peptidyl-dipeptidase A
MTLRDFLQHHTQTIQPLYKKTCESYRIASLSGKTEDYANSEAAQLAYNEIYTDAEAFVEIQKLASEEQNRTPILKREYETIYRAYLSSQWDKETLKQIISLSTQIEQKFSTYRAVYDGKEYTDNEVEETLKKSTDSKELQWVWESHKQIWPRVASDVLDLVRLRNKHAQSLGFKNYHAMSLFLGEQEQEELDLFFDELAEKSKEVFAHHKKLLDEHLATRYGCAVTDLKPRHYQNRYFQEVPQSRGTVDLDKYYQNQNIEDLTKDFYTSIGLDIQDMLANSDLYEKPGKNQHAYCMDCDKAGDVRILCNITSNERWMGTMLHEFGHAVYDKYINKDLPYALRDPAHIFTTEAVAEFFQDLSSDGNWMQEMLHISDEEKQQIQNSSSYLIAFNKLIFAQWAQVLRRFEKALYADPDQDLNKLWRDLVSTYQLITPPVGRNSPDRATKIHIATSPCYYHNYLLGYVLSEQRAEKIKELAPLKPSLIGQKQIGERFIQNVFAPGSSLSWRELVRQSTGKNLNIDIFVEAIKEKLSSNIS